MLKHNVQFSVDTIQRIKFSDYEDEEFAIARLGFLSTRPNSHGLDISEDVLKEYAKTAIRKWVVAELDWFTGDATTHTPDEGIVGMVPEQEVQFEVDDDGYLRAYVDAVISKRYAKDFCDIFEEDGDNERPVSVEMKIETKNGEDMNDEVLSFSIVGITVLGKKIRPSCPQSDITFTRFSEADVEAYFTKVHHLTTLKKFAKERKASMAEKKTYKIDKSKEAMSDKSWGEVDKIELRNKIMEAENRNALVKAVYMLVEEGWEEAPSEHLKYPVMELKDDTFVYNRDGLASALGYAKKEEETSVVNKVEKIYKKLDIEETGKEGESKMAEILFAAVDIGDMWGKLWDILHDKYPGHEGWGSMYCIDGIYEEDNQKFAIIRHRDEDSLYRLDFSLTEEGMTVADEVVKVEIEIVETDDIRKFAEPEDAEKYKKFEEKPDEDDDDDDNDDDDDDGKEAKMSEEDMKAKIAELEKAIEERDNIIMAKDGELEELRAYKNVHMEAERAAKVEAVLSSVSEFMDKDTANTYREEGLKVEFAEVDAWANKVKASVVDKITKSKTKSVAEFMRVASAKDFGTEKSGSVWDRI